MTVRFLSCAERELAEAVEFYDGERPGLGGEFLSEVRRTLARVGRYPNAWPALSRRARRCLVSRFPYGVIYQVRSDCILVVGIMHLKCDPKRWQDRLAEAVDDPEPPPIE